MFIMKIRTIVLIALTSFFLISCAKQDIPAVSAAQEEYLIDSSGGEITIPVISTGIDDVFLKFDNSDKWDIDPTNGNRTPKSPWIHVTQIIEDYPQTKALASWRSGIVLKIEPNESADNRAATVQITSFSKKANVKVAQAGRLK